MAEAYGGHGAVAAASACCVLSPKGNPTLKTLLAVLKMVDMRLSVEREDWAHA